MKVIGIDVAPRRGGQVCDGECATPMRPAQLESYLRNQPAARPFPANAGKSRVGPLCLIKIARGAVVSAPP